MPRALLATLAIAGTLYMIVGISAVSLVGGDALASSERPLALVIEHDWGGRGSDIVSVIALGATMNTTLLLLTAASRMIFSISRRGAFPALLARVGGSGHAPYAAALLALVVAASFVSVGHIGLVASVTDFSVYAIFLMMNVAVIALRFRRPDAERPYRTPLHIGRVPLLPLAAMVSIGMMVAYLEPRAWLLGLAAIGAGAAFWLAYARRHVKQQ
jgi:APA family basic amino acid/polyamine antiporter